MKKFIALLATLAIVLSLAACGSGSSSGGDAAGSAPAESSAPADSGSSAAPAASDAASASEYPGNKNIVLYCGYSAGGSSDMLCRLMAAKMSEILGTSVTVENVTGASGWVLWNQMMESTTPDGYSFFLINSPNVTAGKYDVDNTMKYDQNDFYLVCNHVTDSSCLAIRVDDDRYSDWDSFSSYWKQEGVLLTSASGLGITSDDSTSARLVARDMDVDVDIMASGGSGDNVTFLLNGTTDFLMGNVSEMAAAHNEGQYKVLCVFAEERDPNLPDVPTYKELAGKDVIGCSSRGYAILKDVPDDIKAILSDAIKQAVQDPDMIQQLNDMQNTARELYGV